MLQPFRSKRKTKNIIFGTRLPAPIPKYMPKYQRRLTLHHIHGPKTWMMDFMSVDEKHILNIIHCNTRYWVPLLTKDESATSVMNGIRTIASLNIGDWAEPTAIDTLISDAAKAFTTTQIVIQLCRSLRIKQIAFNMLQGGMQVLPEMKPPTTIQYHNQLAIVDRISRTLRDMLFNVKRADPTFTLTATTLQQLADIYNTSPHETLSKTMGFDVSPLQALQHRRLQDEIVRRWTVENCNLVDSKLFTSIVPGTLVYLYAPKDIFQKRRGNVEETPYVVLECHAGNYVVRNVSTGVVKTVQRKDFVIAPH